MHNKSPNQWFVYMVRCADNSLYTGITIDITRRINEHNSLKKGARYTRSRQPVCLVYQERVATRSLASKREIVLKRLQKAEKECVIEGYVNKSDLP